MNTMNCPQRCHSSSKSNIADLQFHRKNGYCLFMIETTNHNYPQTDKRNIAANENNKNWNFKNIGQSLFSKRISHRIVDHI